MSFIISKQQYLATSGQRSCYDSRFIDDANIDIENIKIYFGHPLYMVLNDIVYFKSDSRETFNVAAIPDGCMSIVFTREGDEINGYLCGVIDEIKKFTVNPNSEYIVMRFMPGSGDMIAGESIGKYTNQSVHLENAVEWGKQVIGILGRDIPLNERIGFVSKVIRVHQNGKDPNYLVKYCVDRIINSKGNIKIDALASETGFTSRHIGKMFERCVGIPPKLFSQIVRLQISMTRILEDDDSLLVNIAMDSGFFDHAHMNRVYKKLIHCSSGEYRKNMFNNLDYSKMDCFISNSK
ncbi:MAG: helix-turn-helix domain-containing protein [Bacillota bacterium]|nr:helix-turn-helix domain-containing protein [Bacillota bacterium]